MPSHRGEGGIREKTKDRFSYGRSNPRAVSFSNKADLLKIPSIIIGEIDGKNQGSALSRPSVLLSRKGDEDSVDRSRGVDIDIEKLRVGIFRDKVLHNEGLAHRGNPSMPKMTKKVLSSRVYEMLKEMIAKHRFSPGTRVNVEALSRELGLSRTPVWEAIRRLELEGLLYNIPYRGVFMTEMTLERALELYQVREVLEGLAGRLAASHVSEKALEKMAKELTVQREVIEREDLVGYSQCDFDFHDIIHKLSNNTVLQEMLETLKAKMQPIRMDIKPILPRLYEGHRTMVEALRSRKGDRVEKVIRLHNRLVQNQIRKEMVAKRKKPVD
jgi:DNA-binding GntR family transcriptional regulator